jgi:hypothetical protein
MTYMWSWKSLRLTLHTWLGLNPQIGRPLSRIVVPLVNLFIEAWKCTMPPENQAQTHQNWQFFILK